jgi:3-oxoadipate enol-lactonase
MPFAAVNGIDVHYRLAGDGPETIVLVNGLADDLETWAYQEAALTAAGYRLLMFDNRGIGQTSKPAGPYSSRLLADDAKALVDHLGITGFHLLGVSMGGMIVQEYVLAYPEDLWSVTMAGNPVRDARRHAVGVHH